MDPIVIRLIRDDENPIGLSDTHHGLWVQQTFSRYLLFVESGRCVEMFVEFLEELQNFKSYFFLTRFRVKNISMTSQPVP